MKKLFLDDLRTVDMVYDKSMESKFDVVRTYHEFVNYITNNGLPDFISFDNDLGLDKNGEVAPDGYAAAKWLVYESGLDLIDLNSKCILQTPLQQSKSEGY